MNKQDQREIEMVNTDTDNTDSPREKQTTAILYSANLHALAFVSD